jgi:hypothetical protein
MTIPEGFAQVTHTFSGVALPHGAAVVYGVENVAEDTAGEIAVGTKAQFGINIMPRVFGQVSLVNTNVKLGPDDTGPSADEGGEPIAGGTAGAGAVPSAAYLITKATALGGRRGKGRMFVPGVEESVVDAQGVVAAGFAVTFSGNLANWLEDLASNGWPLVLLHDPATEWVLVDGQPRRVPVAGPVPDPTTVTSLSLSGTVATQRRRLRG